VQLKYKIRKKIARPKEEWVEVKNTHAPLIDEETFNVAQKQLSVKRMTNRRTSEHLY